MLLHSAAGIAGLLALARRLVARAAGLANGRALGEMPRRRRIAPNQNRAERVHRLY